MTARMESYLSALNEDDRLKLCRDSETALRQAWPHRQTHRARIVIDSNVTMLRNLRSL